MRCRTDRASHVVISIRTLDPRSVRRRFKCYQNLGSRHHRDCQCTSKWILTSDLIGDSTYRAGSDSSSGDTSAASLGLALSSCPSSTKENGTNASVYSPPIRDSHSKASPSTSQKQEQMRHILLGALYKHITYVVRREKMYEEKNRLSPRKLNHG